MRMQAIITGAVLLSAVPAYADLGDQLFKLTPNDGEPGNLFGHSVGISGTLAVIGAHHDDDNDSYSGSAYIFNTATGQQLFKLLADDGAHDDQFGWSVAISGGTAVVGARLHGVNGLYRSGAAYLYDTSTGQQIAEIFPNDGASQDFFGEAVAISGNIIIVGSPQDNSSAGSAYLFDAVTGQQLFKLLPNDGGTGLRFGKAVAISGGTAIIGSSVSGGSAYLFDTATGQQIAKLRPEDQATGEGFGWSVGISGSTAVIGAFNADDNGLFSGAAYLFDIESREEIAKLLSNDGALGDNFGLDVAIDNGIALVGSRLDDDNGTDSGSAYLFDAAMVVQCPADLNGNGAVGVSDLLMLLGIWGPCGGCAADIDGDGAVGVSDLLILLSNWGPC